MHSHITRQMRSSPSRISRSLRQACSLASITPLMGRPVAWVWASSSAAVRNGYGTGVVSGTTRAAPVAASSTTKPPPTE